MIKPVLPDYMFKLTGERRKIAECKFLVRLAALYYAPAGSLSKLSRDIGRAPNYLATIKMFTADTAIALEGKLGREHFPRELFRPDLFLIQE